MSYNPRYGENGRVGKNDFSIDGKSWEYRNPDNFNDGQDRASDDPTYNRNAYSFTNPLYDYDYGTVRDAALELDIGNVNEKEEVDQILDYIRNAKSPQQVTEPSEPKPKRKPIEIIFDDDSDIDSEYEQGIQAKKDSIKEYEENFANFGDNLIPEPDPFSFASDYKDRVLSGLKIAGVPTRGPQSGFNSRGF